MQETFLVRRKTLYAILGVRLSKIWTCNFTKRKETTNPRIMLIRCKSYSYFAYIYFHMLKKNTHKNSMTKKLNQATLNSLTMPYIFIQTIYQEIVLSYRPIPIRKVTQVTLTSIYIMHELMILCNYIHVLENCNKKNAVSCALFSLCMVYLQS